MAYRFDFHVYHDPIINNPFEAYIYLKNYGTGEGGRPKVSSNFTASEIDLCIDGLIAELEEIRVKVKRKFRKTN